MIDIPALEARMALEYARALESLSTPEQEYLVVTILCGAYMKGRLECLKELQGDIDKQMLEHMTNQQR